MNDQSSYALGWLITQTPNGNILWHDGGTWGFGSYVGMLPDRHVGVILLTNEIQKGFPDALGQWMFDRILNNPKRDSVADQLKEAKTGFEKSTRLFAKPASPRPFPPLAPLAGHFVHPSFGEAVVAPDGDALVMELQATGAQLKLVPWDGDVFTATLMPTGRFGPIVASGDATIGFVQFQMDKDGKLNLLRLSIQNGQAYEFRRK